MRTKRIIGAMRRIFVFFVVLISAGILSGVPAHAVGIVLEKLKPLTVPDYIPEEEFKAQTKLVKATPYEDKFLAYQVRLPKDFEQTATDKKLNFDFIDRKVSGFEDAEKGKVSERVLGVVSRYTGAPNKLQRMTFSVEASELTYEISARNWFINYIVSNGLVIEQIGLEGKDEIEALYVEVRGDTTYVVRALAIKNGPRMVIARFALPMDLYDDNWILQAQVLKSFTLLNREGTQIEEREVYGFLDQSYMKYLQSWKLQAPNIRSIDRMRATVFYNIRNDKLDGQIDVFLANKEELNTTRQDEIKWHCDKIAVEDYSLGQLIETHKMSYHEDIEYGVTQAYEYIPKRPDMLQYELWFSFLEGEEYYYVVTLLTPSRLKDFEAWARNTEAYKIMLKEVRRSGKGLEYYRYLL